MGRGGGNRELLPEDMKAVELLPLVTEVVAAKLSNGKTPSSDVAALIQSVYQVLNELRIKGTPAELPEPAVPIKRSVTPDYIVCLEDGRQLKDAQAPSSESLRYVARPVSAALGIASGLSDDRTELCEEVQQDCEECRAWYATASEAREGVGSLTFTVAI